MSIKVVVPQLGQSIAEATIVKWFKKNGERIEKGEALVEIGTDKINTEIPAPVSGIVERLLVEEGATIPVETEIALLSGEAEPSSEASSAEQIESAVPNRARTAAISDMPSHHSPLVRKLAREHHIDLSLIHGTGADGRVTAQDVEKFIANKQTATADLDQRVPMSRMRKLIAEHMLRSKRTTAELTTFFEVDMLAVSEERQRAREKLLNNLGIKLTYLPFVIAAAAQGLREFPALNSSIQNDDIIYKRDVNIGIAVAIEEGLIVPVIKHADQKNVVEIARAAQDLSERARNNNLTAQDVEGGTFSITNPGVFGAIMGTPIINPPQVAILGFGAVVKRAVVIENSIAIRPMAYLSLTYDHRAMDGSVADGFMSRLKHILENQCPSASV